MKTIKIYLFSIVLIWGFCSTSLAQDPIQYKLNSNIPVKKEILIKDKNQKGINSFELMLELLWNEENNTVRFKFDRTSITEGRDLKLCFPQVASEPVSVKSLIDCKSNKKNMWPSNEAKNLSIVNFYHSTDFRLIAKKCYEYVAVNNDIELTLSLNEKKEKVVITFDGLYVTKDEKRPWYTFSSRSAKLEYQASPIRIEIALSITPDDPCLIPDNAELLFSLKQGVVDLKEILKEANLAKTKPTCSILLDAVRDEIGKHYPEFDEKWDNLKDCSEAMDVIAEYRSLRSEILDVRCEERTVTPSSFVDMKNVNERLMNLQMEIYVKKREGKSIEKEKTEYQSIKRDTDRKLQSATAPKDQIDSYNNFCKHIEDALNQ